MRNHLASGAFQHTPLTHCEERSTLGKESAQTRSIGLGAFPKSLRQLKRGYKDEFNRNGHSQGFS